MIRSKRLIGVEVIDAKRGKKLGRVKGVLFFQGEGKILGFIMDCRLWSKGDRLIDINSILSIKDSMMISGEHELKLIAKNIDLKTALAGMKRIFGMKVITEYGERLGYIDDIIVNESNFLIEGYVLTEGIIEDMLSGKSILPYGMDMVFKEDAVIVKVSQSCPVLKNDAWIKKMLKEPEEAKNR